MSGENINSHTRQEIGLTLERARKERGLSLQQVEEATKIRARYLRDLENENFDVLPAVYMLGSLKTYARYLGLDGEALTREFKHRQALLQEEQDQEEPQAGERGGLLASLGRLLGVGSLETGEDDAGTVQGPGHSPRLYLSTGVVLIFVLAIALASTLRAEDHPSVSQVSEPKISQFPSMLALVGSPGDERNTGAENKENQSREQARSPAKDADKENKDEKDKAERSGLERDVSQTAQASSSSATASASAPTSASASASTGSTASAKAEPASVRPEPAATGEPDDTDEGMAAAATDRPSAPSARVTGGPSVQRKEAGPVDATLLGNKIKIKVRNAVRSSR